METSYSLSRLRMLLLAHPPLPREHPLLNVHSVKQVQIKESISRNIPNNEQVCGPNIVGRKLVIIGESSDNSCLREECHDADAIVHAASCPVGLFKDLLPALFRQAQAACPKADDCRDRLKLHIALSFFRPFICCITVNVITSCCHGQ